MAVNVKGIYFSIPAVIPAMQETGGGSIINIASIGAMRPRPGLVWYNASKAAVANVCSSYHPYAESNLVQATKGLAAEYGKNNIRVNALCPLLSATPLFESFVGVPPTKENIDKFLFNVPLGRLTDPDDVANMCLYLGSDEGKFVTGVNLEIDGGRAVGA